jgi:hypothetical protein
MDPISLLLEMPEVDLDAIFKAIPEKIDSSTQTENNVIDFESLVPLGRAIQVSNLIGMCLQDRKAHLGFKPGQITKLLKLVKKSPALKDFEPLINDIKDFNPNELSQLLYFTECICCLD